MTYFCRHHLHKWLNVKLKLKQNLNKFVRHVACVTYKAASRVQKEIVNAVNLCKVKQTDPQTQNTDSFNTIHSSRTHTITYIHFFVIWYMHTHYTNHPVITHTHIHTDESHFQWVLEAPQADLPLFDIN